MAAAINADNGVVSGSAGLKSSADATGILVLQTNGTTALTVDTSQNIGVGVTPSAWSSGYKAIQIQGGALNSATTSQLDLSQNFSNVGGTNIYTTTNAASLYRQDAGAHKWFNAASGTAGNAISFTQAMTLDASGRLLVGTTTSSSSSGVKQVLSSSTGAFLLLHQSATSVGGGAIGTDSGSGLQFFTQTGALGSESYTERVRINSVGMLAVNTTTAITNGLFVVSSNGTKGSIVVKNDDSVQLYSLGTGTVTCSGGVLGFTSDERIKIDDGNYSGGLNAVLNITPKYFYYKNSEGNKDETKGRELGFFAQNIQQTCGFEVVHQPEDPDTLLGIHDRGVMAVLVSAIKEQQAIIESLKARLDAANL